MVDDQLPVDATGRDSGFPVPRDVGTAEAALRTGPQTLDLFEDRSRDEDSIDVLAYWQVVFKRRFLILGILASVVALALLMTLLTPPVYRASATLQIDREAMQVLQVDGLQTQEASNGGDFYQTQYELLKSRALAERVADSLQLTGSSVGNLARHSWFARLTEILRPRAAEPVREADSAGNKGEALRAAAAIIQGGLTVEPVGNSRLVKLNFDSGNPEFSARVANALAEDFIALQLQRRFGASSYAKAYLEDRLRQLKAKLEQSERQLVGFAQKENIVTTGEGDQSLVSQNLSSLNEQLAEAQGQRIRAEARWREAVNAGGAALPPDMLANSMVRTLQQQRADLQGQYQQKLQVFKPEYPSMKQLQGQISELDAQIARELRNIRASVKAEYDMALAQERMLVTQLASLRSQTLDVDNRSIEYTILKREVDTNRQLYDALLQRYKQIGIAGGVTTNNVAIVDRALRPDRPYKPSLRTNLAIGLLLGAVLGVLAAFMVEFMDQTLKTPRDVEQRLRLSVLGIVPKLGKQERPAEAMRDLRSAFSEAYRSVRTALQFSTNSGIPQVLLVSSAVPGEGKSTTAWALANNFAQLGKRVLLIDGDLRNPSLHRASGLDADIGLSNLLAGAINIHEAIRATANPRLFVILAGPLPPNPAELLAGSKLISLLTVVAESYDQIVIDAPPVLGIADAPILANAASGTLLVVEAGRTRIHSTQLAIKRLLAARARLIGVVLSKYDASEVHGYDYDYAYGGYYAYGGDTRQLARK